jgi:uncharacterized protein YlxW (UPF0749 family)
MAVNLMKPTHTPDRASLAQRHWLWQVTALALFLGAILGASLRAQQNFRRNNIFPNRSGVPPVEYLKQVKRNNELQAEIARLNEDKANLVKAKSGSANLASVKMELGAAKSFAGLTAVSGPGVIVTLTDLPPSKVKALSAGVAKEETYIHDVDILQVVNELRAAGAEAISIQDQRLTATSPIRCVGNSVLVNMTPVGFPLKIRAIGDQTTLFSNFAMTGGIMDPQESHLGVLNMVSISKQAKVEIPPYAGISTLRHGKVH